MKRSIIILSFLLLIAANVNSQNINSIREELFFTDFNLTKCQSFHEKLTALKRVTPTVEANEAAAKALIAKHSWNPIVKISSLKEAMTLLKSAVDKDQLNVEIRFLRLYIENSLPTYLGMKDNIEQDKKIILDQLHLLSKSGIHQDISNYIVGYMATSVSCSDEELEKIKSSNIQGD